MKLLPATLFGRVALVLGGGLIVILMAAVGVLVVTLHAGGPAYPAQVQRIATAIAFADRLPAAARIRLAWRSPPPGGPPARERLGLPPDESRDPRVHLIWPAPGPMPGIVRTDWRARHLKEDVREALARAGFEGTIAITAEVRPWDNGDYCETENAPSDGPMAGFGAWTGPGFGPGGPDACDGNAPGAPDGDATAAGPGMGPDRDRGRGRHPHGLAVQARLSDGTWAAVPVRARWYGGPGLLPGLLAALAVFGGGLAVLAVWAAGRVTAPLRNLADAAGRMEATGDAPPAQVRGPREVRQAAHALNEMAERIRRFAADRTRMLAAISHDLRTMLTRLRLRAEFIDDAEQKEKALKDLAEMEEMLSATLAFARDDARAEARTPVDLAALLADLTEDLTEAGHEAEYAGPRTLTVHARPVALQRALMNLLTNAVAYGGGAEVALAADGGTATVTVSDHGPGIPDDLKEKVFDPFYRIETSRSRETGGTGLGLSVARDIVRGHGGDIVLSDREGGGLVATVTLPVASVRPPPHDIRTPTPVD